ncbi:anti-sigma factor family protein [Leucothrix arctica]|uniref:Anti-sigma factor n=1 Tax=Leucothrix arctica TaxID=1481894 RepID=A0A317C3F9_9GAMM|nr:hypothetical protein [Leucothrix arctica]PWQ93185.1 hypothetical protein DKT75_21095 [Leucothrix arctica]
MTTFTDEQLTAFLDGELPEAKMVQIAEALETDESLVERLSGLEVDFAPIKQAFDQLLQEAPTESLNANIPAVEVESMPTKAASNDNSWMSYAVSACFALAIGVGVGRAMFQTPPEPVGWKGEVARYQKLYSKDTLATFTVTADAAEKSISQVSTKLGLAVPTQQFLPDGLTFKRAQTLVFNQKPLAQFMYQGEDGTPIAICVLKNGKPDQAISLANIKGLNAASWNHGGFAYIAIGDTQPEVIESIAKNFLTTI